MKAPSEEIYSKSTQEHNAEKYIHCVTTLSLKVTIWVYDLSSFF